MTALPPLPGYADFVRAAFGHGPFAWQAHLADRLHGGDPPAAVTIPTGLGKTSIVEAWAWALASQADTPPESRRLPLRLAVAINRRVVVDQIEQRATALRQALARGEEPATAAVASRLRALATGDPNGGEALQSVRLRGGLASVELPVTSPTQPVVVSTTIHQLGSRLLFRGFSTPRGRLPLEAALVGTDTLLVVDEAHLHRPFLATLDTLAQWSQARPRVQPPRFQVVQMTATPTPEVPTADAIQATETDHPDDEGTGDEAAQEAGRRLAATKHLTILTCDLNASPAKRRGQLAKVLAAAAETLTQPHADSKLGHVDVVGVMANTVDTARATHERLTRLGHDSVLLTGRIRPIDRDALLQQVLPQVSPDRPRPSDRGRALFVVATQTIEVGADVDFDALVTEAAAFDAVVQRLGRLDRRGRHHHSHAAMVLDLDPADGAHSPDAPGRALRHPAYAAAADHTAAALAGRDMTRPDLDLATLTLPSGVRANHQALTRAIHEASAESSGLTAGGLDAIRQHLADTGRLNEVLSHSATPARLLPDAHLARLAATSTAFAVPDLPVEPFLVGLDTETQPVSLVWRADLDDTDPTRWADLVEAAPPLPGEALDVPLAAARAWLEHASRPPAVDDLETTPTPAGRPGAQPRAALRHDGDAWRAAQPGQLRPGDTVVVPASYGGCDAYGWHPASAAPVADLGDLASLDTPRRRVRLAIAADHADHHSPTDQAALASHTRQWRGQLAATLSDADAAETPETAARRALGQLHAAFADADTPLAARYKQLLDALRDRAGRLRFDAHDDDPTHVVIHAHPGAAASGEDETTDPAASSLAAEPLTLAEHHRHTAAWAYHFAARLGLPAELAAACTLAAAGHDLGKQDARFDQMLRYAAPPTATSEALAKSHHRTRDERRAAARHAAWPANGRHEQLSAHLLTHWATRPDRPGQLCLPDGQPVAIDELDWQLVIHLTAAHHGHARPHFPAFTDPHAAPTSGEVFGQPAELPAGILGNPDLGMADRFHRLNDTYGPWTLALLETTVRLADHAASRTASPPDNQPAQPVAPTPAATPTAAPLAPPAPPSASDSIELPGLRLDLSGLCWYAAVGLVNLLTADGYTAALGWHADTPATPPHPTIDLTADPHAADWKRADLLAWLETHRARDADSPASQWPGFPPTARNGEPLKNPDVFDQLRRDALTDHHTGNETETRTRQALLQAFVDGATHHTPQQGQIYRSNRNNRLAKLWTDLASHSHQRLDDELTDGIRAEPIPTTSSQYFDAGALDALAMVSAARSGSGATAHRTRPATTWLALHAHPLLPVYNAHTTGTDHLNRTTGSSDGIWHRQPTWTGTLTPPAIHTLATTPITRLQANNGTPTAANPDALTRLGGYGLWAAPRRAGDQNRHHLDRPHLIHHPRAVQ